MVVGSFVLGLDVDEPGIGQRIFDVAVQYGVDFLHTTFLTPLPGTRLWEQMKSEGRVFLDDFPGDWTYFTLMLPVARYKHLSLSAVMDEMQSCNRDFYSLPRILRRAWCNLWRRRMPLFTLVGNLSFRRNTQLEPAMYADFKSHLGSRHH